MRSRLRSKTISTWKYSATIRFFLNGRSNALKPAGEYSDVRLVVRNGHVEQWLNGYRLVAYDLDSDDFRRRVAASKFRDRPEFARVHRGRIGLQDHGDVVRFRNIRVREQ